MRPSGIDGRDGKLYSVTPMGDARESNIELAERGYRAWNEDDLDGLLDFCHPEVDYYTSGVFPGLQSVYHGEEGIRRWWAEFHEPWQEIKVIPERIADTPDGVAVLIRFEGKGRQGIETTMSFINTIELRDGLAFRFDSQPPTEEALRELGLD
jgi:ketosteroid isomerase-like protein